MSFLRKCRIPDPADKNDKDDIRNYDINEIRNSGKFTPKSARRNTAAGKSR